MTVDNKKASVSVEMAPMEGITTALYRSVYRKWFKGTDRMYTPFIAANSTHKFKTREKKEISPYSPDLVPQILTNSAEHFIWAARELQKTGYGEVNLNAGCPSATVTTKKKGAGMLADIPALQSFLDEVFIIKEREHLPEISIKTRAGMSSYSEAEEIADLYAKYPFSGVIVHPRIRDDFYNNTPSLDAFSIFYEKIPHEKLVFNGDLRTPEDVRKILERFPEISRIMTGRGLLADLFLPERISRCEETGRDDFSDHEKKIWLGFLEELYEEYERELSEGTALLKMKDLWNFMAPSFPEKKKQIKSVSRSKTGNEYRMAVRSVF